MLNFLPAVASRVEVVSAALVVALPEYPVAIENGLRASSPAVAESKVSAYITLSVWICPVSYTHLTLPTILRV